jgi:hypothetical protein
MQPNTDPIQEPVVQPNDTPVTSQSTGGMKVIQPTAGAVTETGQPPQPVLGAQPSAAAPPIDPRLNNPAIPKNIYPQPQSMTRIDIEAEANKESKKKFRKRLLIVVPISLVMIVVIAGGLLFAKNMFSDLHTVSSSDKGYNYSFKWWRQGNLDTLQGQQFYAYKTSTYTAIINTVPFASNKYTSCLATSNQYTQAFTVKINNVIHPVCASSGKLFYFEIFSSLKHYHIVFITIYPRNSSFVTSSIYPALKTIFGSVKVSN